jgi:hypothetical protein
MLDIFDVRGGQGSSRTVEPQRRRRWRRRRRRKKKKFIIQN